MGIVLLGGGGGGAGVYFRVPPYFRKLPNWSRGSQSFEDCQGSWRGLVPLRGFWTEGLGLRVLRFRV